MATELICPKCVGTLIAPLASGQVLCLAPDCRFEWDPNDPTIPVPEVPRPMTFGEIADAPPIPIPDDPRDLATELDRARELYVGKEVVVYDYELTGIVTEITDDGLAIIEVGSGLIVSATADDFTLAEIDAMPTPEIVELGAVDLTVAAKVIEAAIATFIGDGDERTLGIPPNGWLPQDSEAWPIVEHGAAYAVAIIAQMWPISTEQLEEIAEQINKAAISAGEVVTK